MAKIELEEGTVKHGWFCSNCRTHGEVVLADYQSDYDTVHYYTDAMHAKASPDCRVDPQLLWDDYEETQRKLGEIKKRNFRYTGVESFA